MYSPKVKEEFIPYLYKSARNQKKHMTTLVNEMIKEGIERELNAVNETEKQKELFKASFAAEERKEKEL